MSDQALINAVSRVFQGFDRVTVFRRDDIGATEARVLMFDESVQQDRVSWLGHLYRSSAKTQEALRHREGALRFYGRKGAQRNRYR